MGEVVTDDSESGGGAGEGGDVPSGTDIDFEYLGSAGKTDSFTVPDGYKSGFESSDMSFELAYYGPTYNYLIGRYPSGETPGTGATTATREFDVISIGADFWIGDTYVPYITGGGGAEETGTDLGAPFTLSDSGLGSSSDKTYRMEGHIFEKRILSALQALPPTSNGFLDSNKRFYNKIQQVYGKYLDSDPGTRRNHDTYLNIDFGYDADGDGETFEDFYTETYDRAPWSSFSSTFTYLARYTAVSFTAETIDDSDYFLDSDYRNALTEIFDSAAVNQLKTYGYFYSDLAGDRSLRLGGKSEASGAAEKFYPYYTNGRLETTFLFVDRFTQDYYYYPSGDGKKNVEDIKKRFKTLDYVTAFSNSLIENRLEQILALLTTSVTREADIKIQNNKPLNYNLATSMADDFTNVEAPDTSIEGGSAMPRAESLSEYMDSTGGTGGGGTVY